MSTSPTEQASDVTGRVDRKGAPPGLGGLALPSRVKLQEYALVGVVLALVVIGAILKPDSFPTADNLRAILTQASVVGVLAVGMTFVIATAGIDLSVGSVVAASGIAGGLVVDSGAAAFVAAAVGFGLGLGLVNGSAIAYGKVVPFVATLAMFAMARGLALLMSDKSPISLLGSEGVRWFGTGEILGVPASIVIFAGIAIGG
jgi:ribose transport system permease protein